MHSVTQFPAFFCLPFWWSQPSFFDDLGMATPCLGLFANAVLSFFTVSWLHHPLAAGCLWMLEIKRQPLERGSKAKQEEWPFWCMKTSFKLCVSHDNVVITPLMVAVPNSFLLLIVGGVDHGFNRCCVSVDLPFNDWFSGITLWLRLLVGCCL